MDDPVAQHAVRLRGAGINLDSDIQIAIRPGQSTRIAAEDPCTPNDGLRRSPLGNQRRELGQDIHTGIFSHHLGGRKKARAGRALWHGTGL